MKVSVRDLKDRLSEYLRRPRAGEETVATSHGTPVGRLVGPDAGDSEPALDAVARLRAQPWVRAGNGESVAGMDPPVAVPAGTTDELVDWVRGD